MTLGELMAYIDARKRFAGRQMGDFMNDPMAVMNQWGAQMGEDVQSHLNDARTAQTATGAEKQAAQERLLQTLMGIGPLSVHNFRTPKGAPPTYQVTEHAGQMPDLSGLSPAQIKMWQDFLDKQAAQENVIPFPRQ